MKKTLTALTFVLFTAVSASAGPVNFGFEAGLAGWSAITPGGSAVVVGSFNDGNGPLYGPYSGDAFLVMTAGNAEVDQLVSQPFAMAAGETIWGAAAFTTLEAPPGVTVFNDTAKATITNVDTNVVVWSACVLGPCGSAGGTIVGPLGSTPWQLWSFTHAGPIAATYVLAYEVQNQTDAAYDSYALFDAGVPDGGSALALLGLGMIGLSTLRRKLF